jgi:hypothetical protein
MMAFVSANDVCAGRDHAARLPEVMEQKRALSGKVHSFRCRLAHRDGSSMVVLFVSDRPYRVDTLELPAGTVTLGHFWADRPYNAYHWMDPDGRTLAYYFNIADQTDIGDPLSWRDLVVDVLLRPDGALKVLDEDELPLDLPATTRTGIHDTAAHLRAHATEIAAVLDTRARELWPGIFGSPRP